MQFENCFTFLISRQEFKHDVKQPGGESIILENDNLKVEFESFRGLLKVILTPPLVIFTNIKIKCNVGIDAMSRNHITGHHA